MTGPAGWETWLAVCGIRREAAIWGGRAVCGGGRSELLRERIEAAIAERRPAGLISFGVCGELVDRHAVGDLVIGRASGHGGPGVSPGKYCGLTPKGSSPQAILYL